MFGATSTTMRGFDTPGDSAILNLTDPEGEVPLNAEAEAEARAMKGALIFISSTFRPDISHCTYRCATRMGSPTRRWYEASRRILIYLIPLAFDKVYKSELPYTRLL